MSSDLKVLVGGLYQGGHCMYIYGFAKSSAMVFPKGKSSFSESFTYHMSLRYGAYVGPSTSTMR